MTRCARHNDGHVRGIIGDRVMVIFDRKDCFRNAVECAITMNSVAKYVINKHFRNGEVICGIGIDTGKMLATKTGIRRKGSEQSNYRNLVWLGRPANIASKLTDLAKQARGQLDLHEGECRLPGSAHGACHPLNWNWVWREMFATDFVKQLEVEPLTNKLVHKDPTFQQHVPHRENVRPHAHDARDPHDGRPSGTGTSPPARPQTPSPNRCFTRSPWNSRPIRARLTEGMSSRPCSRNRHRHAQERWNLRFSPAPWLFSQASAACRVRPNARDPPGRVGQGDGSPSPERLPERFGLRGRMGFVGWARFGFVCQGHSPGVGSSCPRRARPASGRMSHMTDPERGSGYRLDKLGHVSNLFRHDPGSRTDRRFRTAPSAPRRRAPGPNSPIR